jgi:hypothetical protein
MQIKRNLNIELVLANNQLIVLKNTLLLSSKLSLHIIYAPPSFAEAISWLVEYPISLLKFIKLPKLAPTICTPFEEYIINLRFPTLPDYEYIGIRYSNFRPY